ncbi:MAG: hypothetical protein RML32_01025 [Gammaproteobacteria bacterium]|nr:hypothetical protein [Gammaproteobacteria bacterium]
MSLMLTLVVFLALPDQAERLQAELPILLQYVAAASALAGIAVAAFWGEIRRRPWRRAAQGALLVASPALLLWAL